MDRFSKIDNSAFTEEELRVIEQQWEVLTEREKQKKLLISESFSKSLNESEEVKELKCKFALTIMFIIVVLTGGGFSLIGIGI